MTDAPIINPESATTPLYAGFWIRLCAFAIDWMILLAATVLLFIPLAILAGIGQAVVIPAPFEFGLIWSIGSSYCWEIIVIHWLYFALMESSAWGATFGKRALGISVTDMNGNRIGFARATGRYFAKYLSAFIMMLGYVMAAFTSKKQALHDMIAETVVMRR